MFEKRARNRKWVRALALPAAILSGTVLIGGGTIAAWQLWSWLLARLGQWVVGFCELTILAAQ